jgi:hypothetical protein
VRSGKKRIRAKTRIKSSKIIRRTANILPFLIGGFLGSSFSGGSGSTFIRFS